MACLFQFEKASGPFRCCLWVWSQWKDMWTKGSDETESSWIFHSVLAHRDIKYDKQVSNLESPRYQRYERLLITHLDLKDARTPRKRITQKLRVSIDFPVCRVWFSSFHACFWCVCVCVCVCVYTHLFFCLPYPSSYGKKMPWIEWLECMVDILDLPGSLYHPF